jgi:tricorn protease
MKRCFLALLGVCFSLSVLAAPMGYYQSPSLQGDTLVLVAEGDLWRSPAGGGLATRLTSHAGVVSDPALSPGGEWVAFTGRYGDQSEVYVMPASGGEPRQLTWSDGSVRVVGWHDGQVLFATTDTVGPAWSWRLRTVAPEGGKFNDIPLADARDATVDDQGNLYFVRFGLAVTGDNVREYRGGAMAQLWRFDLDGENEAVRIAPEHAGNLTHPLWFDGQLFVVSDANGADNLATLNPETGELSFLTEHRDFEVREPSLSADGRIAYQLGADIRVLNLADNSEQTLPIQLASDRAARRARWIESPSDYLDHVHFAPSGKRVLLNARGQIAIAGAGNTRRVDLALPAGTRARDGVLSPDGSTVYAFLDKSGETEIWRLPADNRGEPEQLTDDANVLRTGISLSPNGRYLAHHDMKGRLWLYDTERERQALIDQAPGASYNDLHWAPNSQALALTRPATEVQRQQLRVYDLEEEQWHTLTSDRFESSHPRISPDGRWLYFLSQRHFEANPGSPWGDRNLGPGFDRRGKLYALALQPGNTFPVQPANELIDTAPKHTLEEDADIPAIDFDGLAERLFEAPIEPGNYSELAVASSHIYLLERPRDGTPRLAVIALGKTNPKLDTYAEGISNVMLAQSEDGEALLLDQDSNYLIAPVGDKLPGDTAELAVALDGWRLRINPVAEWEQMFHDAWRMQRDFLYDQKLRGQDWKAAADRHAPLIERLGTRRELDDLLSQMVAELGVLHSQIRGGDYIDVDDMPEPAFLGGQLSVAEEGLSIEQIYTDAPERPSDRSPLARPGVELEAGDVITHINNHAVTSQADLATALLGQAGMPVRLDIQRGRESLAVLVEPISRGANDHLRYRDWVNSREQQVLEASEGRIGYLHMRAMTSFDIAQFVRSFYAHFHRDGLIIDVRRNRGGNIDSWLIEKLLRQAWAFWERDGEPRAWNMQQTFRGHLAVLTDPLTYSDGETFAAGVKALELGTLIGQRTAGAGVWLSDQNRLVDNGVMRAASYPQFGADGQWLIEGHGVEPDIEVENKPYATYQGEDAQLDAAIEHLLQRLEESPIPEPEAGAMHPRGRAAGSP